MSHALCYDLSFAITELTIERRHRKGTGTNGYNSGHANVEIS